MTTHELPHQMPAIGGWFFDEKSGKPQFLMPPYPGVDDAVETPAGLAYRKLARRDVLAQLDDNTDRLCALLADMDKPGADLDAIETRVEIVLAEHRVLVATLTALKGQVTT